MDHTVDPTNVPWNTAVLSQYKDLDTTKQTVMQQPAGTFTSNFGSEQQQQWAPHFLNLLTQNTFGATDRSPSGKRSRVDSGAGAPMSWSQPLFAAQGVSTSYAESEGESDGRTPSPASDESPEKKALTMTRKRSLEGIEESKLLTASLSQIFAQQPLSDSSIFCHVSSRLGVIGNAVKHPVTVAEMRRRLAYPEALNTSVIASMLRKAKTANGGMSLRDELQQVGLDVQVGRRKGTQTTLWTSLVEKEAQVLAAHTHAMVKGLYPVKQQARSFVPTTISRKQASERGRDIQGCVKFFGFLQRMLNDIKTPMFDHPPAPIFDPHVQTGMDVISCLTHGYCMPNQVTHAVNMLDVTLEMARQHAQIVNQLPNVANRNTHSPNLEPLFGFSAKFE